MLAALMGADVKIQYEEKEYKLGALTLKEIAQFVLDYQFRDYEIAKERVKGLSLELANKIINEEYVRCRDKRWIELDDNGAIIFTKFLSWETPEVRAFANTEEGVALQLYYSLKVNHPEITRDFAIKIVNVKSLNEIFNKIMLAQGLLQEDLNKEPNLGEQKPNQ